MHPKLIALVFSFFFLVISFSQNKKTPIPATLNELHYYNKSNDALQLLEKGKADFVSKAKGFGFGGATTNFELSGDKSTARVVSNDSVSFVVSLAGGAGDPGTLFSLFKVELKKGKRIANYINTRVYGGKNGSGDGIISFSVKRIGDQVFELIPSVKLEKGEYLFVNKATLANYGGRGADAFAFGVD